MLSTKQICQIFAYLMALQLICAYPSSIEPNRRITADTLQTDVGYAKVEQLYRLERSLSRLRRAVADLPYEEADDDMELAEINVFRPLFRYRAEVARQVPRPTQQQIG
ncbi:hypothetical protein AWZ03_005243 [Drosophila navojoa]|uniref:Corticotropin-releasing factor domain-containing protein n=1 Tax=Drosophila navojoa TaxID=7232 RepID=A0A484BHP7_DRONA|nr:uncharacterized protein LOC108653565 [Drosophila navojoa]TDG48288.1 hypothetical protein AWZ03_005243 [Drosophila navojoa]